MALNLLGGSSSGGIDCGSAAMLDSLSTISVLAWIRPTALAAARIIMSKCTTPTGDGWMFRMQDTSGNLRANKLRAGGDTAINYVTNDAPLSANAWRCVAATMDTSVTSSCIHIYTGSLTANMVERAYGTSDNGSGTSTNDDSAKKLFLGNIAADTQAFVGDIGPIALFNRILSLGEIQSWQFRPRLLAGCVGFWRLGRNGTSVQPDLSGNGNAGTVETGITRVADVPLGFRV